MPYTAIMNKPGYLPDTADALPVFDTIREAWDYLRGEYIEAVNDADPSDLLDDVVDQFATKWNHEVVGTIIAPTPGYDGDHDLGMAYSVMGIEER